METNKTERYLIKLYYMNKKVNPKDYQILETTYFGNDATIEEEVSNYICNLNKNFNFKIDHYNIFKQIVWKSVK